MFMIVKDGLRIVGAPGQRAAGGGVEVGLFVLICKCNIFYVLCLGSLYKLKQLLGSSPVYTYVYLLWKKIRIRIHLDLF